MDFIKKNKIAIFVLSLGFLAILGLIDQVYSLGAMPSFLLWFATISLFVYTSYLLLDDFEFESGYLKLVLYLFLAFELIILVQGFRKNGISISSFSGFYRFFHGYYLFWSLVVPLFVFFNKKISTFKSVFHWSYILGIIALVVYLLSPSLLTTRGLADNVIPGLAYGCGILLLFSTYIEGKKVNLAFLVIFISLLSFTYLARRNNMLTIIGFVSLSYILNIRSAYRPNLFRYYPLVGLFAVVFILSFTNITDTITERLTGRLTEDTRSDVFAPFFMEMEGFEWMGKGLEGTYYYPIGGELEDEGVAFTEVEYRDIIEIGYLQMFLSGGVIHVFLFLIILVPAAINGIFRSRNLFSKAAGIIIFLWLVDMFVFGIPRLSFHYIFVWISVGICYKESIRSKSDEEIREEFQQIVIE